MVLDLVRNEVARHYAVQVARLDAAIAAGELLPDHPAQATDPAELAAFAAMSTIKIGAGAGPGIESRRSDYRRSAMPLHPRRGMSSDGVDRRGVGLPCDSAASPRDQSPSLAFDSDLASTTSS